MSNRGAGRKADPVWQEFTQLSDAASLPHRFQCKRCLKTFEQCRLRVDRLKEHLHRCPRALPRGQQRLLVTDRRRNDQVDLDGDVEIIDTDAAGSASASSTSQAHGSQESVSASTIPDSGNAHAHQIETVTSNFVIKTSEADRQAIETAWARFFYRNRLSFSLADDPAFRSALETTRPGLSDGTRRPILTRKRLSGELLDLEEARCKAQIEAAIKNKNVVLSQVSSNGSVVQKE